VSDRVLVLDSGFTVSVVQPVYREKWVLLADTPSRAAHLAAVLRESGVRSFLLVSREPKQLMEFAPFALDSVDRFGRTTIQRWRLPP
jgi:hypothetical protein